MFEIMSNDLLGRRGAITTTRGKIRTPCFVPVVHPVPHKNLIDIREYQSKFDVDFIITSSYILRKQYKNQEINLHNQINFQGPIMTDSGAYQSLVYGEIETSPEMVISYQEKIGSDFAVPLDIPISINDSYEIAKEKVEKTIKRCQYLPSFIDPEKKTIWVGPIQGGKYLDLIQYSAKTISNINCFGMYAIGSVVEIMSNYQYKNLFDIIITTKQFLDPSKPLHLFGAGHPSMFPFIIAAGCDSFDSAAYSLYAQEGRYLTVNQTIELEELEEFPCCCPVCIRFKPQEIKQLTEIEQMKFLAKHNLYVCQEEIKNVRHALSSGTLWELLEQRSLAHPLLRNGFKKLIQHSKFFNQNTPLTKKKGLFLLSKDSLFRPEIKEHKRRLTNLSLNRKKLVLISLLNTDFTDNFNFYNQLKNLMKTKTNSKNFEFWILNPYFEIIPLEISDVFPLSQYVSVNDLSNETINQRLLKIIKLIQNKSFSKILLIGDLNWINNLKCNSNFLRTEAKKISAYNISINKHNLEIIYGLINEILINQ
ncbi:MAG: tRNA guanosine(15) transglycosylase TgtA [Candidatus Heimdallarchaeota archaeon]|nr:tRNA guanosine(15) transglycosylase TgtA [Candidatus Heimdallarchaeota archaeon]